MTMACVSVFILMYMCVCECVCVCTQVLVRVASWATVSSAVCDPRSITSTVWREERV